MNPNYQLYLGAASLVSLALLATGCSSSPNGVRDPVVAAQNEANAPQLTDHWASNCMRSKVLDAALRIEYDFGGDTFKETQIYFSEEDCRADAVAAHVIYEGIFKVYTNASPNQLDMTYEKATVVANNDRGRSLLDDFDFCGIEVWNIGEAQDVTTRDRGVKCPLKATPHVRLDIFRVIGDNRLELGSGYIENGADQPAERPAEFVTESPFFKP